MRKATHIYQDPVDVIWLHAARQMGMTIERSSEVFASWDGTGVLQIGTQETLDPDDSLAQMILHETCHGLIEGPEAFHLPDWGLRIDDPAQRVREHSCLRLQAALAAPYGLRQFFAATTNFRKYYDQLPADPLVSDGDSAVEAAVTGMERATTGPWSAAIREALESTQQISEIVKSVASKTSLWSMSALQKQAGEVVESHQMNAESDQNEVSDEDHQ